MPGGRVPGGRPRWNVSGPWGDKDPLIRWLRALSVLAILVLVIYVVLFRPDLPLVALLMGAVLLQLGYEVAIPGLARGAKSADESDIEHAHDQRKD